MAKARITCIFCQAVISADQNLNKYKKHLEISHDIFYQQDMALTLAFLTDEENQNIVEKLMIRVDYFITEETMGTFDNIFKESDPRDSFEEAREDVQIIEEENIASIQHILQGDLSDTDDDDDDEEDVDDPLPYHLSDTEENVTEKTAKNSNGLNLKIEALQADIARRKQNAMPRKNDTNGDGKDKNDDNKEEILCKFAETKNNKKQTSAAVEEIYRFLQDSDGSDEELDSPNAVSDGYNQQELNPTQDIYNFLEDSEDSGEEEEAGTVQFKQEPNTPEKTEQLPMTAAGGSKHGLSLLLDQVVRQTKKSNQIMEQQLSNSSSAEKKRRLK